MSLQPEEFSKTLEGDFREIRDNFVTHWKEKKMYEILCIHNRIIENS